ncbi:hypothetical protein EP7_002921 [Isosphaeraceae bacterium EP7]
MTLAVPTLRAERPGREVIGRISDSEHSPYLPSNRQFPRDSSRLASSGDRINISEQGLTTSGQGLTTREATRTRIDGENRMKRLGIMVAMPDRQATAGLSSE